jgi:hypothetical protein
MPYSLVRDRDGAGDSGAMSLMIYPEKDRPIIVEGYDSRPRVGGAIRVGSINGRTYHHQDWWQTTIIEEILEDTPDIVRFRTKNSTYTWKKI